MSVFPADKNDAFKIRLFELLDPTRNVRGEYLELGRQILSEMGLPPDALTNKQLSDKVADLVRKENKQREKAPTPIADGSMVADVWVKRPKGTYRVKPEIGRSLTETLAEFESGALNGPTMLDKVKELLDSFEPRQRIIADLPTDTTPKALKSVISDAHVAMETNPEKTSLYAFKYDADVFNSQIDEVINDALLRAKSHGPFEIYILDVLGDSLDGFRKLTTRGGHNLPQNMSDEEAMGVYVDAIVRLMETLIYHKVAGKFLLNSVVNDNHAGSFAACATWTINRILGRTYGEDVIRCRTMRRFMEHYSYGEHTFILTHGKDKDHMKAGLPFDLTPKARDFVDNYIDTYGIKNKYIHLEKGDLHRLGYTKTKKFDYRNFMTFAPPSAYGQHNFSGAYAGFTTEIVPRVGPIQVTNHEFDLILDEQPECAEWVL